MGKSILITGSSGYIGQHLISYLLSKSLPALSFLTCDLKECTDFGTIRGQDFDVVIHLAAHSSVTQSLIDPDECLSNNAFKLIPFLMFNDIGKLIFTSTGGAIYGNRHFAREEDASWNGCISPYGQSKYLAEKIIRQLQPNHTILRLGNVYGGDDSNRLELAAHARFKKDNPVVVYGKDQTRDFVHVGVVCEAIRTALVKDVFGTFNIGSGVPGKVREIAEEIAATRNVPVVYKPAREGEITNISLNISKAQEAGLL